MNDNNDNNKYNNNNNIIVDLVNCFHDGTTAQQLVLGGGETRGDREGGEKGDDRAN